MVTTDGKVIGEHAGVHNFTVASARAGVATGSPLYVIQIKNDTRQVVVAGRTALLAHGSHQPGQSDFDGRTARAHAVAVKIRHKHQPARPRLSPLDRRSSGQLR